MSLIKPRTRGKQRVQYRTRLDRENHETLFAYAAFIGEDAEYVLNELIDTVLAKDKAFTKWRADHPESCAPQAAAARAHEPRHHQPARIGKPAAAGTPSTAGEARP